MSVYRQLETIPIPSIPIPGLSISPPPQPPPQPNDPTPKPFQFAPVTPRNVPPTGANAAERYIRGDAAGQQPVVGRPQYPGSDDSEEDNNSNRAVGFGMAGGEPMANDRDSGERGR